MAPASPETGIGARGRQLGDETGRLEPVDLFILFGEKRQKLLQLRTRLNRRDARGRGCREKRHRSGFLGAKLQARSEHDARSRCASFHLIFDDRRQGPGFEMLGTVFATPAFFAYEDQQVPTRAYAESVAVHRS